MGEAARAIGVEDRATTRRRFSKGVAATAVVAGVGGVSALDRAQAAGRKNRRRNRRNPQCFAMTHSPEVYVTIGRGRRFTVRVLETGSNRVLEKHRRQTAQKIYRLRSDHITISRVEAPRSTA